MHRNRILHRDIKPLNILLDNNLHPKIIDFGLSKTTSTDQDLQASLILGTTYYIAPEILNNLNDEKSDVYAFSILMYEVLTGLEPYEQIINPVSFLFDVSEKNHRPDFNKCERPIKESVRELCEQCWAKNPSERPTFEEIFQKLAYNNDIQNTENYYNDHNHDKDKYKYYLDGVNVDEVLEYAASIDIDCPEITLDTINNLTFYQINPLIRDSKQLKEDNKEMSKKISDLDKLSVLNNQKIQQDIDLIKNENAEIKKKIISLQESFSNANNQTVNKDQIQSIETKYEQKFQQMQDSFQKFVYPIVKENKSLKQEMNKQIQSIEAKYEQKIQQILNMIEPLKNENDSLRQENKEIKEQIESNKSQSDAKLQEIIFHLEQKNNELQKENIEMKTLIKNSETIKEQKFVKTIDNLTQENYQLKNEIQKIKTKSKQQFNILQKSIDSILSRPT